MIGGVGGALCAGDGIVNEGGGVIETRAILDDGAGAAEKIMSVISLLFASLADSREWRTQDWLGLEVFSLRFCASGRIFHGLDRRLR